MARRSAAAPAAQPAAPTQDDAFLNDDAGGEGDDQGIEVQDDGDHVGDDGGEPPAHVAPPAATVGRVPPPATPPSAEDGEGGGTSPSWKDFRDAKRQAEEYQQQLATQRAENARIQAEYQAAQQRIQQAVNPQQQAQDQPGITRPYTQQELVQLRETDILEYNRVIGEMALQQQYTTQQQIAAMQETAVIRQHIEDFTRGDPARQLPPRPDYMPAMMFLEERVGNILKATGIPEAEIQPRLFALSKALIIDPAMRNGQSVAAAAYQIAQVLGWQGEAGAPAAANGGARPTAPASPQEKVRQSRARTQAASGSVGTIPGGPPQPKKWPTLAEFRQADDATLDQWDKELPGWDEHLEP